MRKIYIVEDDGDIRDIIIYALQSRGFEAVGFDRAESFFEELEKSPHLPDLCLLDVMLPEEDGFSILKKLRNYPRTKALPVIMLTAKVSEHSKVKGLDMGADDYITKPFGVMELISRVNAVLRRSGGDEEQIFDYLLLSLDNNRRSVYVKDELIPLTFKEYELLYYLFFNKGLVLSRDKIMEAIWGCYHENESRTLDMHIRSLRQKLGEAGDYIKTIRNVGYKLGEEQFGPAKEHV
ncbi:MAG: response regulator transcription factor [Oscillospiraceae bacterium]|nr:response regulator transcription factor [Oscillospiraceae bacterium]